MQVRTGQVDLSTGELMEGGQLALVFPKRRNGFQVGGWIAMSQGPMIELAKSDIGTEGFRVMLIILANIDFENWIQINQSDLAKQLGMKRQNFSRAVAKLVEIGALLEGPKVGRSKVYRLSPSYGWKGSAKGHHEALRERMRARGLSLVENGPVIERDPSTVDMFEPSQGA